MDFLEKAVAKAESSQSTDPIEVNSEEVVKIPAPVAEFTYTKTRVFTPNYEELLNRRVIAQQRYDPMADMFRMLRTKVLKQLRTNNWNSFAITSPTQGAGKSMISVNLAISMAMEVNQTVLLVDLDLRYPKVNWYFDTTVEYGLLDYINNDVPLDKILLNPSIDRLVLLPGKGQTKGSSDIISAPKMRKMIEDIKSRYQSRIIIFDMPPVLPVDDVIAAMEYYDALLFIVEDGANKPEEIRQALQIVSNTNLLGVVLNKADSLPVHKGYY